ncbi:uncharacterized protein BO97DRAFT_260791 [Aspergillus homomorphus CBS 101889]|uniref:Uncharacterized protein n=1 Tax=Aspergillus homomorphus (strain CBS 101889) TaxID=1450537 RepID=A0A395I4M9_ASPHC|nr:hypothetical protein BO97DRAFT_260791 [Aspergillus homomorphus CBS 101889]RAL14937.1 hypothetical protein BO97DRAFT_260791 [Aspergillus homomorphus CBS 101889]
MDGSCEEGPENPRKLSQFITPSNVSNFHVVPVNHNRSLPPDHPSLDGGLVGDLAPVNHYYRNGAIPSSKSAGARLASPVPLRARAVHCLLTISYPICPIGNSTFLRSRPAHRKGCSWLHPATFIAYDWRGSNILQLRLTCHRLADRTLLSFCPR